MVEWSTVLIAYPKVIGSSPGDDNYKIYIKYSMTLIINCNSMNKASCEKLCDARSTIGRILSEYLGNVDLNLAENL